MLLSIKSEETESVGQKNGQLRVTYVESESLTLALTFKNGK